MDMKNNFSKGGQIWVETVIYTLIGLSLIGLVLAIVTPKINEMQDKSIIEQTIDSLNVFDSKVNEVISAPGNKRVVEFRMKRGSLYFDTQNDSVKYELDDSRAVYSEPGVSIQIGRINVTTIEGQKRSKVSLLLDYSMHNITFNDADGETVKLTQTSVPYRISIENKGFQGIGKIGIDIRRIS